MSVSSSEDHREELIRRYLESLSQNPDHLYEQESVEQLVLSVLGRNVKDDREDKELISAFADMGLCTNNHRIVAAQFGGDHEKYIESAGSKCLDLDIQNPTFTRFREIDLRLI